MLVSISVSTSLTRTSLLWSFHPAPGVSLAWQGPAAGSLVGNVCAPATWRVTAKAADIPRQSLSWRVGGGAPATIGGIEPGAAGGVGTIYEGYTLSGGDDFTDSLSSLLVSPA